MLTRGVSVYVPGLLEVNTYGSASDSDMGPYDSWVPWGIDQEPIQAMNQPVELGFYTLRGGIDWRNVRCSPRAVGCADVHKDLKSGDATFSSLGSVRPQCDPEGKNLAARWLNNSQTTVNRPVGVKASTS